MAEPEALKGHIMKERLPGAIIEIDTPLGTKIPMRFGGDGLVAGEAGILGSYLGASKDRGRWWVEGDRLCIKWFRWFESQPRCMDIRLDGARVLWRKDDGESGTATLAEAPKPAAPKTAAVKPKAPTPQAGTARAAPRPETPAAAPRMAQAAAQQTAEVAPPAAAAPGSAEAPAAPQTADAAPSILEQAAALAARFATPPDGKAAALEQQRMSVGALDTQPVILNPTPDASDAGTTETAAVDAQAETPEAAIATQPVETAAVSLEPRDEAPPAAAAPAPTPSALPSSAQRSAPLDEKKASPPGAPTFRVARVAADDTLNIRNGPSEYSDVVGIISPNGRGVRMTGACRGEWCPIRHGGLSGWVNRYYLAEDAIR